MALQMSALQHPIELYRQILFLPLTLRLPRGSGGKQSRAKALNNLRQRLEREPRGCWTRIADPLRHLGSADHWAYQEFVYFHAYIQDFLFNRTQDDRRAPMWLFGRQDLSRLEIVVGANPEVFGADTLSFDLRIDRVHLYVFSIGVAILCLEVSSADSARMPATLAHALALQNALRRVYPPYFKHGSNGLTAPEFPLAMTWHKADGTSIPFTIDPGDFLDAFKSAAATAETGQGARGAKAPRRCNPVARHWRFLLEPLDLERPGSDGIDKPLWSQIVDERMPSMTLLSSPAAGRFSAGDWLRLVYMDPPTPFEGPTYGPDFETDWTTIYAYDRWWFKTSGTRYLISPYSFIVVGTPSDDPFFPGVIEQHFRLMYADMALLNHFQFAALLALSGGISLAVESFGETERHGELREAMKDLREQFLEFMERYWFSNVSNQIQARDLYARMRGALATERLYDEVRGQLTDANAYLDAVEHADQTEAGFRLNTLAAFGLGIGLPLAFLSLFDKTASGPLLFGRFQCWQTAPFDLAVVTMLTGLSLGGVAVMMRWLGQGPEGDRSRRLVRAIRSSGLGLCFVGLCLLLLATRAFSSWPSPCG